MTRFFHGRAPPLSLLADRCNSMRELKQVHAQMLARGRIDDNYACSRLIAFSALSPSGDLPYASSLFRQAKEPNTFMWNTLIRALAGGPSPSDSILLYNEMQTLGVSPGKHTFPFLLKGCVNSGFFSTSLQVQSQAVKRGLDSDLYVVNNLIRAYGFAGQIGDARKMFDEMPDRNLILWTTMLSAYAQNEKPDGALRLFEEMVATGVEPGGPTLAAALTACARGGEFAGGEMLHSYMESKGLVLGVILGTALLDMYAKNGAIGRAMRLFHRMPERNIATWNAMICGLARHGRAQEAIQLFDGLEKKPNDVTFVGVLSACCHAGLVDEGREIFLSMERDHCLEPKLEHFACMVDLLGRSGRLAEAEELIDTMKGKADVVILGALLAACRRHGDVEVAERAVSRMLELEPDNHGVYVVLSNMYAEVGRWEDVELMRKAMVDGGLKKIPAWSCVDREEGCG